MLKNENGKLKKEKRKEWRIIIILSERNKEKERK